MAFRERRRSAENVKVEKLEPSSRDVNVLVKVVSKSAVRGTMSGRSVADALVGDETGCIYLTLWEDNIGKVKEGDTITIKNGYVSLFRGSMHLNIGRYGSFAPAEAPISEVKIDNNLSDRRFEEQTRYRGSGYRRRF